MCGVTRRGPTSPLQLSTSTRPRRLTFGHWIPTQGFPGEYYIRDSRQDEEKSRITIQSTPGTRRARGGLGEHRPRASARATTRRHWRCDRMINDSDALKRRPDGYAPRTPTFCSSAQDNAVLVPPSPQLKAATATADKSRDAPGLMAAAAHAAVPTWSNMVLMGSLIFGGCCANVSEYLSR